MKHFCCLPGLILLACLFAAPPLPAQKTHSARSKVNTPEEEMAGFKLAEGFVIELVASEREGVVKPIDLTFDDAGRLWTQTARMYPLDPVADIQWNDLLRLMDDQKARENHPSFRRILDLYQGKTRGSDQVLILSGLYGQGPLKTSVWAEGLSIPMSVLPYKDGAFVAQGSELFFLQDKDQDGKADERLPLLTGFGFTDTHTMAHVLVRAPGDWIHFSQGALNKGRVSSLHSQASLQLDYSKIARFSLDGRRLELVSSGLNNIWGFQLRHNGQWYGSEANDLGYSVAPMEPGTGFPGIGSERLRPYQPWMPELHAFRVGGTGISGTAFADDAANSFPQAWQDVAFLANPITSSINAVKIVRNPDGSVSASHLPDLLTSADDWFRPVNLEFGPDGCLYIADWYNKIVSHNELPTTHPDRDKTHGRIWRIRHVSQQPRPVPNLYRTKTKDLVKHLQSPSLWEKRAAWHQICDRPLPETRRLVKPLLALARDPAQTEITRIHALWSLEGLRHYDARLMAGLVASPSQELRREAIRALASFALPPAQLAALVKNLVEDPNPMVRAQVLRTLAEAGTAAPATIELLVRACKPALPGNALGGAYERKFERFLALRALEQYPGELRSYLQTPAAQQVPAINLLWAIQALPAAEKETAFLRWWPQARLHVLDEPTFISISSMLGNKAVYEAVEPLFLQTSMAATYLRYALQHQSQVQSAQLGALLQVPVSYLLQQAAPADQELALDVIGRYKMQYFRDAVAALVREPLPASTLALVLRALEANPRENEEVFTRIVQDLTLDFGLRTAALHSLVKTNPGEALQAFQKWMPELNEDRQRQLASTLSASQAGAGLLLEAHERKLLGLAAFDLAAAERSHRASGRDPRAGAILEAVSRREAAKKSDLKSRLARYMALAEQKQGQALKGEVLFQSCLMCHQVGNKGQSIAPALDGSAARESEALLTAILDPDAAVESGFAVYRVIRRDGSSTEGYLVKKEKRGTTIALMGGRQVFTEAGAIQSEGFLAGRSFMPKGLLDHYTDSQVADLLAYIQTLK